MKATFQGLKYSIKFILESRKDKSTGEKITEHVPILTAVSFNGNRLFHNVGFRTNINVWEVAEPFSYQRNNTFNNDGVSASTINTALRKQAAAVDKVFSRLEEYPSVAKFRELLKEELNYPEKKSKKRKPIIEYFDKFIEERTGTVSIWRIKQFTSCKNHVKNYTEEKLIDLNLDNITLATINDFDRYLRFDPENPRGQNTISGIHTRLKTFFNYCNKNKWTNNNPYENFHIEKEVYGDPVFLTKDELNTLYEKEIKDEKLARVRDAFCLQCFIGTRVGDFAQLKHENIIDNSIHYIPSKTVDENPTICKIPLTQKAWSIINRYDIPGGDLVPYISGQKYNVYLKELFVLCELYRKVTVLNPLTRKHEIVKLSEIAHSHMARKTFVGLLFKHTKNEVIGSMSGHSPGSKAFRRYYNVDQDDRENAIKNLE